MRWKKLLALTGGVIIVAGAIIIPSTAHPTAAVAATPTATATLPLVQGTGADPDIHTYNGKYYMLYNGDHSSTEVRMRVASSLAGLSDGSDVSIWTPPSSMPEICCRVGWGGYLFPYQNRWYIYMQGDNGDQSQARSFVLESASNDPLSSYTFKAYIPGVVDNLGYAAGPALVGSQLYMFQTYGERIWAAKASNPWTLTTGWSQINAPAATGWECAGGRCLNEGSNVLVRGNTVYNIFSAGGYEDPNYCVGMMTATLGTDLTQAASWQEKPGCVFSRNDTAGSYGPASMTWFKSPDGSQDWVAYHVKTSTATTFDGNDRRLMAKQVTWSGDQPVFGSPAAVGSTIALPSGDSGTVNAAPSAVATGTDSLAVFTRTGDDQVRRTGWTSSSGWSGWTTMGNGGIRAVANPGAYSRAANVIDTFSARTDGSLIHTWTTGGGAWSPWENFGTPAGGATSAPAGSSWGADRQSIYVRATGFNPVKNELAGRVYERWWSSASGWSSWQDLGAPEGGALSASAPVSRAVDRTDVFVRTSGGHAAVTRWNGTSWSSWQSLGAPSGGLVSNLAAASWGSNRVHLYGTARDGNVYEKYWTTAGGWSSWQNLGAPTGGAASSPAVASRTNNSTDVIVRAGNGDMWKKTWSGANWTGWEAIPTP